MSELSAISKLDIVLKHLSTERGHVSDSDISEGLKKKGYELPGDEIIPILNQLIKNEWVEFEDKYDIITIRRYWTSFAGKFFIEMGGYQEKTILDEKENIRLERIEKNQRQNQTFLTLLTAIIAVGTIIASIYYIIQIIKDQNISR